MDEILSAVITGILVIMVFLAVGPLLLLVLAIDTWVAHLMGV